MDERFLGVFALVLVLERRKLRLRKLSDSATLPLLSNGTQNQSPELLLPVASPDALRLLRLLSHGACSCGCVEVVRNCELPARKFGAAEERTLV